MKGRNFLAILVAFSFVLAGCLGGVVSAFVVTHLKTPTAATESAALSARFPLNQLVDDFGCPKGLTRIVQTRGVEDGFAPTGDEPAHIDPRLLRYGYFADLADGATSAYRLRNFDEGGTDRILVDHFELPPGIVSGRLVIRAARGKAGADNDSLRIGDIAQMGNVAGTGKWHNYDFGTDALWQAPATQLLDDGSAVISFDFSRMASRNPDKANAISFLDYLGQVGRSEHVDVTVGDDSRVDAMALLACRLPVQAKGVTFAENYNRRAGQDISALSCSLDPIQRGCDPFEGDRLCSVAGPIACYREGSRTAPESLKAAGLPAAAFVGGEVRLSKPVRGDQFAHLGEANAFCQAQFGREWRVLSYHEGGGGSVVSYSSIPPGSRGLVNIRDQQYANCWDRDLKR